VQKRPDKGGSTHVNGRGLRYPELSLGGKALERPSANLPPSVQKGGEGGGEGKAHGEFKRTIKSRKGTKTLRTRARQGRSSRKESDPRQTTINQKKERGTNEKLNHPEKEISLKNHQYAGAGVFTKEMDKKK